MSAFAHLPAPDRERPVRIILEARDDMPVQVRNLIAQAREVDLVGVQHLDQGPLEREHHSHDLTLAVGIEVVHFGDVPVPDYATQARIVRFVGPYGTTEVAFPQYLPAGPLAEHTSHHRLLLRGRWRPEQNVPGAVSGCPWQRSGRACNWGYHTIGSGRMARCSLTLLPC